MRRIGSRPVRQPVLAGRNAGVGGEGCSPCKANAVFFPELLGRAVGLCVDFSPFCAKKFPEGRLGISICALLRFQVGSARVSIILGFFFFKTDQVSKSYLLSYKVCCFHSHFESARPVNRNSK